MLVFERKTHEALIAQYRNKSCTYFEKINGTTFGRFGKTEKCLKIRQTAKKYDIGETTLFKAWPSYSGQHFSIENEMRSLAKMLGIYVYDPKINGRNRKDIIDLSKPNEINTWFKMIDAHIKYRKTCYKLTKKLESLTLDSDSDSDEN